MATVTIHQWPDLDRGLRELRRVARGPVVVLTFDTDALARFWLRDYVPEVIAVERRRFPAIARVAEALGGDVSIDGVPLAHDCPDGFCEAYYARPEALLDPAVRRAQSGWMLADADPVARGVEQLREALDSGAWDARHGHLRSQPAFDGSVRLIVATPAAAG